VVFNGILTDAQRHRQNGELQAADNPAVDSRTEP
jgi:hypothetical protein